MPRLQTHTLLDPFELALPTPTPSAVVPRVAPGPAAAAPAQSEPVRAAVHSETRARSVPTEPDPSERSGPASDAWARARCWCSEE
jgi:hypothetical protein